MMNLMMMTNFNEIKSEKSSLLNSSSKLSNTSTKTEFEDIMVKKDTGFNKKSSNDDSKKIEIDTEDKEKLIKDLEEKLDDNYDKEDLVNLINFYLTINLINNEQSLEIDSVEFVDVSNELILEESSLEDVFGVLNLNNNSLLVPVIKNTTEQTINREDGKSESNFLGEIMENFEGVTDFNLSNIEDIIKNNKDIFNQIESILNDNIELEDKSFNFMDTFNKKMYSLQDIKEELNLENLDFEYMDKINNQTIEDINKFSSFLMNQRSSTVKLNSFNTNDKDMELLMKMVDSDSNIDSSNMLNLNTYSFKSNMNDTINTSVVSESIRQSSIEMDISQTIQYMKSNNINELTLRVKPRELGEITINLVKNKDMSNVVITVEKEELFSSIKSNLGIITRELKDLGLQVNDISIQIKSDNLADSNFNFMSNYDEGDSENQNPSKDKNLNKTDNRTKEINVLENEVSEIETENQINLLA